MAIIWYEEQKYLESFRRLSNKGFTFFEKLLLQYIFYKKRVLLYVKIF